MKNQSQVISLFEKYGFEYRKTYSNHKYLAFTYKSGFFHNAELVSLYPEDKQEIEAEMSSAAKQLEALSFSTKKSFYSSLEELRSALFDGFFNVSDWKEKTSREYKEHCTKILSVLPPEASEYTYMEVPYVKDGKKTESTLIDEVCSSLSISGPQLSIIEAPAGYGKTCTSYEIIKTLVEDSRETPIPFFTEFSRDRQARVFSHIFVREVDRSFSSVSSSLVIDEVKEGKIVIVLDGFDEILHDSNESDGSDNFEEAEPMLETIGELLTGNAKIILTSRRSAIFDGEVFNEWMERYSDKFRIIRYRLDKPEVNNWIPPKRLSQLSSTEIDVSRLANPVLLSYLRFVDDTTFEDLCLHTERIVQQYFNSMLEREMERQKLPMNPEQQKELLMIIATDMCDHNYTSDSKEKIISIIKEKAGHLLNHVRTLYTPIDRPSIDKLATTLSNHAFFDRSSRNENHIEFINEFVFGNYIAENIRATETNDWIASDERFVEPAVLSYTPRTTKERSNLWIGLSEMKEFLDPSSRMKFECFLTGSINENTYDGLEISSLNLRSTSLFENGHLENCVFNDCTFSDTTFHFSHFSEVTFINCTFWDCYKNEDTSGVDFYNCKSNNDFISPEPQGEELDSQRPQLNDVESYILTKLWPVGSLTIERLHHFMGILFKTDDFSKKEVLKGIKSLKKRGILQDANNVNFIAINKEKFSEIKSLLGRY